MYAEDGDASSAGPGSATSARHGVQGDCPAARDEPEHGAPIPPGKKNLAYAIRYRRADRTLTDEEANAAHAAIVARVTQEYGAQLRDQ